MQGLAVSLSHLGYRSLIPSTSWSLHECRFMVVEDGCRRRARMAVFGQCRLCRAPSESCVAEAKGRSQL